MKRRGPRSHSRRRARDDDDKEDGQLSIALCIPLDRKDIPYLLQCLKSIHHQVRQPDLVVISISRIPADLQIKVESWVARYPLIPSVKLLFSEERQYAGKNRNVAAAYAVEQGADILSFFDADDIAHPRRLELIELTFQCHPELNAVLHAYKSVVKEPVRDFSTLEWPPLRGKLYTNCFRTVEHAKLPWRLFTLQQVIADDPVAELVQNGHISLKAELWKKLPYNEKMPIGQDSDYNARLYKEYEGFGLISDKLCLYLFDTPRPKPSLPQETQADSAESPAT